MSYFELPIELFGNRPFKNLELGKFRSQSFAFEGPTWSSILTSLGFAKLDKGELGQTGTKWGKMGKIGQNRRYGSIGFVLLKVKLSVLGRLILQLFQWIELSLFMTENNCTTLSIITTKSMNLSIAHLPHCGPLFLHLNLLAHSKCQRNGMGQLLHRSQIN